MEEDDIYDCPQDKEVGANFKSILSAFQNNARKSIPIKVAKDGRYQAKDDEENKPAPAPKPQVTKPWLTNKPALPLKSMKKTPPKVLAKTSPRGDSTKPQNGIPVQQPTLSKSSTDRSSIFPPQNELGDLLRKDSKKKPLQPINGIHPILPPQISGKSNRDSSPVYKSASGSFRKRSLPPVGGGPPPKPQPLPGNITIHDPLLNVPADLDDDDQEIYDDIQHPDDFPPPPPDMLRPVSMIPEMLEEDEVDKRKSMRVTKVLHESDDDQELYDDIEQPTTGATTGANADYDDGDEEIYEAVDEL